MRSFHHWNHQITNDFFVRRRQVRVARQSEDGSWFPWHENSAIYRPFRFSLRWRWQRQKMLLAVYQLLHCSLLFSITHGRCYDAKEGLGFGLGGCWRSVAHLVGATHMVYVLGNQWLERERWMKVKMQKDPWRPATEIVAHIAWHVFLKEKMQILRSIDGLLHSSSKIKRSLNNSKHTRTLEDWCGRSGVCSCRRQGHGGRHGCRRSCCVC